MYNAEKIEDDNKKYFKSKYVHVYTLSIFNLHHLIDFLTLFFLEKMSVYVAFRKQTWLSWAYSVQLIILLAMLRLIMFSKIDCNICDRICSVWATARIKKNSTYYSTYCTMVYPDCHKN